MRILLVTFALWVAAPAAAGTIVLDFEEEPLARYEPSFVSAECGCVRFSEGHELAVVEYGSRALLVGEEGGDLELDFLVPVVGLSLDFLSFYPTSEEIDYRDAHLVAYAGGQIVAEATFAPDPAGPLFQTISLVPGTAIERARFWRVALGENEPISAVVDNVVLITPEPDALALFGLALAGAWSARRRNTHR